MASGVHWNLLGQAPNPGLAFSVGMEQGAARRREAETRNALAAFARNPADPAGVNALLATDPALGFKAAEFQRDAAKREAMSHLFDPEGRPNALARTVEQPGGPPPPLRMNEDGTPPSVAQAPAQAPGVLVDPMRLPRRTDGLRLNQEALRQLYRIDPESALVVQKHVFDANHAQFKAMQENGAQLASIAYHLKQLPPEQRGAELEALTPRLSELGVDADQLSQADLSDAGLDRYIVIGQSIGSLLDDARADRRLAADVADDEADNARADRNTESLIAHRGALEANQRRGQDIASADRRRGQDKTDERARRTDARGRRGQDLTDKRVRDSAGFRGKGGGNRGAVPTATNPTTGEKMEFRGGKWVKAQ